MMDRNRYKLARRVPLLLAGACLLLAACSVLPQGINQVVPQGLPQILPKEIPLIPVTALQQLSTPTPFTRIVMGGVGLVLLVAGFSFTKFLIHLLGFLGGGLIGIYIGQMFFQGAGASDIIGFLIGGVIGIGIAAFAANVGIFLVGALIGVSLAQQMWPTFLGDTSPWWGMAIAGILGGVITLFLFRYWVAGLTSLVGAPLFGLAINLAPMYWVLLFIAGVVIQTLLSRQRNRAGV